jgi:hypothetical protein
MSPTGAVSSSAQPPQNDGGILLAVPSWLLSLMLHAALLAVVARALPLPSRIGDPLAADRVVGISFEQGNQGEDVATGDGATNAESTRTTTPAADADLAVDDQPPVALELPTANVPRIGPGVSIPKAPVDRDAREMVRSSGVPFPIGQGTGGGGGTTFFGHKASGSRFVYVLDSSGSMYDHGAIAVAKAELMSSLAQLDAAQQFLVIFYNDAPHPMVNLQGKTQLLFATDANRTLAGQFIRAVQPDLGTRHLPALLLALSFNPEVIFFLTDAGEPVLDAADLDRIKRQNGGRTQIHTIEFGKGGNLKVDNFLKRLARENSGGHAYRDVTTFRKE